MTKLLSYLVVVPKDEVNDGLLLELCGEYDSSIEGYCIVCPNEQIPNVEDWITHNISASVDHCLRMFRKKPDKIMKFICTLKGIDSLTYSFVSECGGLQGFLDKYVGNTSEHFVSDICDSFITPIDSFDKVEDLEDITSLNDDTATDDNSFVQEESFGDRIDPDISEDSFDGEVTTGESSELLAESESVAQIELNDSTSEKRKDSIGCEESDSAPLSESKEVFLTADEQLQLMLQEQRIQDAQKNGEELEKSELLMNTDDEAVTSEDSSDEESPDVCRFTKEQVDNLFNSDGTFATFSEEQTIEVMRLLKSIDEAALLDGLDPDDILSKDELQTAITFIETFGPGIYKEFFLNFVKSARSDRDLIRATLLLDDFARYISQVKGDNI